MRFSIRGEIWLPNPGEMTIHSEEEQYINDIWEVWDSDWLSAKETAESDGGAGKVAAKDKLWAALQR